MPEDHDERAGYGEHDDFHQRDEFDDLDDLDDDEGGPDGPVRGWPAPGYPPAPPGFPPGRRQQSGGRGVSQGRARRGWLWAVTAVVAAAAGFGVVAVALRDVSAGPATVSAGPGSGAAPSSGAGNGTRPAPDGGVPSLPPGATEHLEIGGPVSAVSAASITIGGGDRTVTAAVTRATKITGKVTGIGGIRVGDLVSASITGANGKLTVDSIQDPASLPSGSGQ